LSSHGFNTAQANKLIAKAKRKSGKRFISEGYIALTDRGRVLVKAIEEQKEPTYYIYESDNQINEPLKLNIRKFNSLDMGRISKAPGEAWFDAERLQFPLQLRKWRKGDRFRPLGMKGSKKLSDYFTDEKMSRFEKENTWLLCSGGAIAWVVGKRISESFKVGEKTKKVWNVQIVSK
jgi:tRNA(Ile)-lysidine synthase